MNLKNSFCTTEQAKKLNRLGIKGKPSFFNVENLGLLLPDMITTSRQYELWNIKEDKCWLVLYVAGNDVNNFLHKTAEETEAAARAEMLIYLLEKKIICKNELFSENLY